MPFLRCVPPQFFVISSDRSPRSGRRKQRDPRLPLRQLSTKRGCPIQNALFAFWVGNHKPHPTKWSITRAESAASRSTPFTLTPLRASPVFVISSDRSPRSGRRKQRDPRLPLRQLSTKRGCPIQNALFAFWVGYQNLTPTKWSSRASAASRRTRICPSSAACLPSSLSSRATVVRAADEGSREIRGCLSANSARKAGAPSKTRSSRFGWETANLTQQNRHPEQAQRVEGPAFALPPLRASPVLCHLERP